MFFHVYKPFLILSSPLNLHSPVLGDRISISSSSITASESKISLSCRDIIALHRIVFDVLSFSMTVSSTALGMK